MFRGAARMKRLHETGTGIFGLIGSARLTIFWRCDQAPFSSRNVPKRRPGNEPSTVLAEDSASQGSGNADLQPNVRNSGWSGQGRPYPCDSGCVTAHPASWRASASYRPLRAVWAVAPGHSGVRARSPDPFSAPRQRTDPKGIFP
jgi:hypothetical protein